MRLNITRSWDNPEISDFALFKTLSGIDTTKEDTTHPVNGIAPVVKTASISVQPKITVNAHCFAIDAMGMRITKVEIIRPDGRSVPLSINGSKAVSKQLIPGLYLVKIQAGEKSFNNKIMVSR